MIHSTENIGAGVDGVRQKSLGLTPAGLEGDVPKSNPWSATYPNHLLRNRDQSHIVFGKVNRYSWHGSGNLSIKTVFSGFAEVESGGGIHRVEPTSYVVINHGREYSIEFNDETGVDGMSLYFEPKMARQSLAAFELGLDEQLDNSNQGQLRSGDFFERIFEVDFVHDQLKRVREELPIMQSDPLWVQESLHLTLALLIKRQSEVLQEVDEVQAVRANTKEELYRRLYKARDYAYATLDESISLDDLAYVACLSTNYFLRSFRGLFKQTPHQFIIDRRMDRAKKLLLQTNCSVSEVCAAVGFQSLGSFSWLFKRRVGLSPEAYRRNCGHPSPIA